MKVRKPPLTHAELARRATWVVVTLAVVGIILLLFGVTYSQGQTVPASQPSPYCFVRSLTAVQMGSVQYERGTGTLVNDRQILTCYHVLRNSYGPYSVQFSGGPEIPAALVATDPDHDLALLEIARPVNCTPVSIDGDLSNVPLMSGGFGPGSGAWRWVVGSQTNPLDAFYELTGEQVCDGQVCCKLDDGSRVYRDGDSGGPVLNQAGKLAGVAWGAKGRVVYFCGGEPLRRFLDAHLPRRPAWIIPHATPIRVQQPSVYQTQPTQPVLPGPAPSQPSLPAGGPATYVGGQAGPSLDADDKLTTLPSTDTDWQNRVDAELQALKDGKQDRGTYVSLSEYEASMKELATDIHGPEGTLATTVKTKLDAILGEVNDIATKKIDEKLKPIDEKLGAVQKSLAVQVIGHAATFFGYTVPPWLTGAGAVLGGPLGAAAAGLVYWRLSKRFKAKPQAGSGGAGSTNFQ